MNIIKKIVLLLSIFCLTFISVDKNEVFASSESGELVLQKSSLADDILVVKNTYRGQVESYRRDEKEYKIALDQYEKHQTLVSIERVVSASKQAMLSRNQVLVTYITLLKLNLIDADAVELSQKEITLKKLDATLDNLNRFNTSIDSSSNRDQINSLAIVFDSIGSNVKQVASETLVLLAVGKLQSIYDTALPIQTEINSMVATDSGKISDAKKKRAINEMKLATEEADENLEEVWENIASRREEDQVFTMYKQLSQTLNPVFAKLSRVSSFMEELLYL